MVGAVAVYDHAIWSCSGPRYREGRNTTSTIIGSTCSAGQLPMFDVRDVNGDGKADIIMRRRIGKPGEYREILVVLSMGASEAPFTRFFNTRSASATVGEHQQRGQARRQEPSRSGGSVTGYMAANYREPIENQMDPMLFPGDPSVRRFGSGTARRTSRPTRKSRRHHTRRAR